MKYLYLSLSIFLTYSYDARADTISDAIYEANGPCNNYQSPFLSDSDYRERGSDGKLRQRGSDGKLEVVRLGFGDVSGEPTALPGKIVKIGVAHLCDPKGNEHVVRFLLKCDVDYLVGGDGLDYLHQGLISIRNRAGTPEIFACTNLDVCHSAEVSRELGGLIRFSKGSYQCSDGRIEVQMVFGSFYNEPRSGSVTFTEQEEW